MHPFTLFPDLADFIRAMPKAELHVHLEGAIQPHTLLALARQHNAVDLLPAQDVDGLRRWFRFTDFPHFVEIYVTIAHLLRTPDDFALIVREAGAAMAAQNIRYSELTVTPYTHTHSLDKGLTIDDIVAGIEAGRRQARAEHGVEMRWVFDIARETGFRDPARFTPDAAEATLDYALANREHGVIGLGLGGYEVGAPPEPFAEFFAAAQAGGLHSLPHAGETVGPASVWGAIEALGAERLGHGVRAIEEPALLSLLRERQIPLELCPTSNVCLHLYRRLAEHPFPHLDRMGLLVTVNSDDPPLFNTSLMQEYEGLAREFGYGRADLVRIARNAFVSMGAEDALKQRLLTEFDRWAAEALG